MLHFYLKEGASAPTMFESFAEAINGTAENHNLSFYTRMDYKLRICQNLDSATFNRFPLVLAQFNVADENMNPAAEGVRPIELDVVERHINQYDSIVYGTLAHDGINSEDWFFSESQLYGVNLDGTIVELSTGDTKSAAGNQLVVLYTFVKMGATPYVAIFMNDGLVAAGSSADVSTPNYTVRTVTAVDGSIVDLIAGPSGNPRTALRLTDLTCSTWYLFGLDNPCPRVPLPIKRLTTYNASHRYRSNINELEIVPDANVNNVFVDIEFDFGPVFASFEGNMKPRYQFQLAHMNSCYEYNASKPD